MKILFNTLTTKKYSYPQKASKQPSFKGFDCPQSEFELKNLYNIPCPVCSVPMLRRNQIDKFVDSVQDKTGEDLIAELQKYQKYYHETEALAAQEIVYEAGKSPKENIKQIVDRLAQTNASTLIERRIEEIEKIRKLSNGLSSQEQKAFCAILDEYIAKYTHEDKEIFPEELSAKLLSVIKNQQSIKKRIEKAVKRIPNEEKGSNKFFKKNAGKKQTEIAARLVTPSYITCEHIKPKSQGGADNTANYLAECEDCNSKRNDRPFSEWIGAFPLFARNFKMYIEAILDKLQNGELSSKYDTYLEDVTTTISKETNGKIRIEAPKVERIATLSDEKLTIEDYLSNFKAKLNSQQKELDERKKEIKEYETNPQFHLIVEFNELSKERTNLNRAMKDQERVTATRKDILDSCYKKINELRNKKEKIAQLKQEDKQFEELKTQIKKIEAFLSGKNIPEIEAQYIEAKTKLDGIKEKLSTINNSISNIEKKITFPQYYQDLINEKKALLSQITEQQKKEKSQIQTYPLEQLEEEIAQQERRLNELIAQNSSIDTSNSSGGEVINYKHFLTLINRINFLKNANENSKNRPSPDDIEIFNYAQIEIQRQINELIANFPSVQYQVNLDEMAILSANRQKSYENLERARYQNTQQKELIARMAIYDQQIATLNSEIELYTKKLEETKKLFQAASSELLISTLEDEIAQRLRILHNFEDGSITEEEFIMEATTI